MNNIKSSVYTVQEIMGVLKIGRNSAYSLIKENRFPVIRIKNNIRIPIDTFNEWMHNSDDEYN